MIKEKKRKTVTPGNSKTTGNIRTPENIITGNIRTPENIITGKRQNEENTGRKIYDNISLQDDLQKGSDQHPV